MIAQTSIKIFFIILLLGGCGTFTGNPLETDEEEDTPQSNEIVEEDYGDAPETPKDGVQILLAAIPSQSVQSFEVTITSIIFKSGDVETTIAPDQTTAIDLAKLEQNLTTVIGNSTTVPDGDYDEIRLVLSSDELTFIDNKGESQDLKIPSASSSGLKIKSSFTIASGEATGIVLNFDLRQSIKRKGNGKYQLKPVIRAAKQKDLGAISGRTDFGVVCVFAEGSLPASSAQCEGAVGSAVPDDGAFKIGLLPAGTYRIRVYDAQRVVDFSESIEVKSGKTTKVKSVIH